jgi:hypothetical protein
MNFLASANAIGALPKVNGISLVNGLSGIDGNSLKIASDTAQTNFESEANGISLVNGRSLVNGSAVVNGRSLVNGISLVNSSTVSETSNSGAIFVFDATDIPENPGEQLNVPLSPICFITGTTAGKHWIIPGTFLSDNFDVTYGLGTLTISKADIAIAAKNTGKNYGDADPDLHYDISGLAGTDTETGSLKREPGEDAGSYEIRQGSLNAGNNYNITFSPGTFTIGQRTLNVTAAGIDKDYDGLKDASVVLSDNRVAGDNLTLSYTNASFADKNAGDVKVITVAGISITGEDAGNYKPGQEVVTATAKIRVKNINVTAIPDIKEYDGSIHSNKVPAFEALMTGDLVAAAPVQVYDNKNAGTGKTLIPAGLVIADGNGGLNYTINYITNNMGVITAKLLTLTPANPVLSINEGDPLPVMNFIYSGSVANDVISCSVTVLRDKDNVPYNIYSTESAGRYSTRPVLCNSNYSFASITPGVLYVNPYGPGTHPVKPILNCVEKLFDGPGLNYIANFEYKNDNSEDIYIPVGVNNQLLGNYDPNDVQPVLFRSGGGFFSVRFDGNKLSWTVSSRDEDHNASMAANANSSSTKCGPQTKSATLAPPDVIKQSDAQQVDLIAYPNPVTDKVTVSMKGIEAYELIQVLNYSGNSQAVTVTVRDEDKVEIDMSALSPGTYFIRVAMKDTFRVFTVIKR